MQMLLWVAKVVAEGPLCPPRFYSAFRSKDGEKLEHEALCSPGPGRSFEHRFVIYVTCCSATWRFKEQPSLAPPAPHPPQADG